MQAPPSDHRAFSLVEVVIALGIAAFALAAVIGLCSVALNTNRESADDTRIALMARAVISDLERQGFEKARQSIETTPDLYFDREGRAVPSRKEAAYRCALTARPDTATTGADGTVHLVAVSLTFTWPAQTPTSTKKLHASLARTISP
jgi:uncharacterized protein (TIGR02598 family)